MVLFRPRAFDAFAASHSRVRFIIERVIDLAISAVTTYVHLWNGPSNVRNLFLERVLILEISLEAGHEVDTVLAPDVITHHNPSLAHAFDPQSMG